MGSEKDQGKWGDAFPLANVAVHLSLLSTGKVLYWGRRSNPGSPDPASLDEQATKTYLLDVKSGKSQPTASAPLDINRRPVNLFCSGHSFQSDGTLLVVGGHISDGHGTNQACVYDPIKDTWTAKSPMNAGRWYPSTIALPSGNILAVSGSDSGGAMNLGPQILQGNTWQPVASLDKDLAANYPRLYTDPKGRIFVAGTLAQSKFLDLSVNNGIGSWVADAVPLNRAAAQREYAASATYDSGKIIYIGGGGGDNDAPTTMVETIDLNSQTPVWTRTADIKPGRGRRHHFATVLPDGTVLVTGGTSGSAFNDVTQAVHQPELWNPNTGLWTSMASELFDRCYHGTALLLPDATILSAGGGEWAPGGQPNPPKDSILTAQIFSPPYLFKGTRPTIAKPPSEINYRQDFTISVGAGDIIDKVSFTRLASVTHCCNMSQSFTFLKFKQNASQLTITAPSNGNLAPPGYYMLFVLNKSGIPSEAPIIRLNPDSQVTPPKPHIISARRAAVDQHVEVTHKMLDAAVVSQQERPAVVVGLTSVCPYGLGPCWGGAYEALQHISDIDTVRPMPNQDDSIAFVYLKDDVLPDIDVWRSEMRKIDSGTYTMRGIEMTLCGEATKKTVGDSTLVTLAGTPTRPQVVLAPFLQSSKLEYNRLTNETKPMTDQEAGAYGHLCKMLEDHPSGLTVEVTGRLQKNGENDYSLDVRNFLAVH